MKKIGGFILFIIAQVTTPIGNIIGFLFANIMFLDLKDANEYYGDLAYSKDQHSNVVMQKLFNVIMIRQNGESLPYAFGNPDETISSVFGKNERRETLTRFGRFWNRFLDSIEEDHSTKSIEEDENND